MRHLPSSSALALLAVLPVAAPAVEAAAGDADTIIVTGKLDGYRAVETTSGTKTPVPVLDVPQSISVVTEAQLADQQIRSIADLVRLVPGVSAGQGEGHRDQITLRGNNSTADFFVDGLRDDVQHYRSFYNIDRIEVHKGPNAMIFGRGGGGGIVNRVQKGALLTSDRYAVTGSADSFGSVYSTGDANLRLGAMAALRVNGFYERLDNHRDAYEGDRYALNPVIGADLGDGARLQIGYEYVRDDRVVDRGVPSASSGLRDTFFGVRDVNRSRFEAHAVRLRGEADLGDTLKLTTQALYGDYDKVYTNVFPATGIAAPPAVPTFAVEAYSDPTRRKNIIGQSNLVWTGSTGAIDHVILAGAEFTDQDTTNERINGFFDPLVLTAANRRRTIALGNPLAIPPVYFIAGPAGNSNRAVRSRLKQVSVYAQDQIGIGDHVDVIAGVRYDRFDNVVTNRFTAASAGRIDHLWSPRAGLVLKPAATASLYVSYSRSFLPQSGDQFLSLDATGATLEPERFDNYEAGAKWDIRPGLTAAAAVYRLDRGNTRAPGAVPGTVVQTGAQRSEGFEIGLTGRVMPNLQTAIGYAYTDGEIRATTAAAPAGRRLAQVPRHQLSIWGRYDFDERFGLGLGLYHQSSQFATISNTTRLPGYTRIDAAAFFRISEHIQAQVNVENLTDTSYFPNAHSDANISTGAPMNARLTLSARF